MKRQAHFILLLGFLYVANNLATVQAEVRYIGPDDGVVEGQRWAISCNAPDSQINWTRNGSFIPQLRRGEIKIDSYTDGISTIVSGAATQEHSGYYQCVPGPKSFYLLIKRGKGDSREETH